MTVGEEGFFNTSGQYASANPFEVQNSGQSFEDNHKSPNIDYVSMHLWPDNWVLPIDVIWDMQSVNTWIADHEAVAAALGKPLVLSEVRLTTAPYQKHVRLEIEGCMRASL